MKKPTTLTVKYGDKVRVETHDEMDGIWLDLMDNEGVGYGARLTSKQVKKLRKALKEAIK